MRRLFIPALLALSLLAAPPSHAQLERYRATMSGPNAAVPNNSVAYGMVDLLIDRGAWTMKVTVDTRDFSGGDARLHCCSPQALGGIGPVASMQPSFPGFLDSNNYWTGSYERTFDLNDAATYNAAFIGAHGGSVTAARDVLLAGLAQRQAYVNVYSAAYPNGEMRGFLVPTPVPEPGAWAMLLGGVGAIALVRRRKDTIALVRRRRR